MGKKKDTPAQEEKPAEKVQDAIVPAAEPTVEDTPIVKELKALDEKYLAIEREYEKEVQELQKKYTIKQAPLLQERTSLLTAVSNGDSEEVTKTGTPACKGFWLQAMKHLPAFEDQIEEWDEPVLEYLSDITKTYIDESDLNKGFKLNFHFVENPYFSNTVIWKEYHTQESSPYTCEIETSEIKAVEIDWKPGKNVTVETIKKKTKGGGAKKQKQKGKEKEEPRDSFFRNFFRNLKPDMPIPEDVNLDEARQMCDDSEGEDDEAMMELLIENDYEIGCSVRDMLIPFAVRWYTGEAAPDDYDDDGEEDEEDMDEDDEEEDDDDDDEDDHPKGKGKGHHGHSHGKKKDGNKGGGGGGGKGEQECKQQ